MPKKKKENKKKKIEDITDEKRGLSQETKNGVWGVASFGFAILSVLAFWGKAGVAGQVFASVSKLFFGWGIFLIPVAFLILGISFIKSFERQIYKSALIGTSLFVLSFLGTFHIVGGGDLTERISQGGYFGLAFGYPLFKSVGFISSFVILILAIFVSFLVALDIPFHRVIFKKKLEEGEGDEESEEEQSGPLKDNIVIRQGNRVVDDAKTQKESPAHAAATLAKKQVKPDGEHEFIIKSSKSGKWTFPPMEILHSDKEQPRFGDINANANIIKRTLSNFSIDVEMGEVSVGPTVTQFTLRPAVGVKLAKITALRSDLSLALAAHPIRIEAPIPGKSLVGIEVPNKKSATVGLRDMFESEEFKKSSYLLPLAIGRDVAGFPIVVGLEKMPHMLIAGATGTGKSVSINTVLLSLLYKHSPDMLKLILVDPKRVELSLYNHIPHLITPVIVDTKKVVNALRWAVREMERRYEVLSESGSRDILSYNTKQATAGDNLMPFIVVVIDELADIMASHGRDVEAAIVRLAQMARAVGIHLIVSTQRPSVEVITGLIKANITSRVALQVASQVDSRTILDASGAESLLGNGDMLLQAGDTAKLRRIQGSFVTEKEVKDVVKFIKQEAEKLEENETEEEQENRLRMDLEQTVEASLAGTEGDDVDDLYLEAKDEVVRAGKASASFLQRRLKVGYARAARLLDDLERKGVIGPGEGAKPRDVFVKPEGVVEAMPADEMPGEEGGDSPSEKTEEI
ncbi:MAG: DNA translocase FtsK 4TM domain-containing protein [bacterium]|nr:DNA translocase FtsK 4TM domain-containing protein [bacterium]